MAKISRKRKHLVMLPVCALFFFIGVITVQAATYYVATVGNDSYPGTVNQPFRTIARGISLLEAGDTLYIRAGTYSGQGIDSNAQTLPVGTSWTDAPKIAAYPGETVTINGQINIAHSYVQYLKFEGLTMDGGFLVVAIGGGSAAPHHIKFTNMEIKNGSHQCVLIGGLTHHMWFTGGSVHDCGLSEPPAQAGYIFYMSGDDNLIENMELYNVNRFGIHTYDPINKASRNIVRNNVIHHTCLSQGASSGALMFSTGDDNHAYNNVLYSNVGQGIQVLSGNNAHIYNNTVYGGAQSGVQIQANATGAVVRNNILYNNAGGGLSDRGVGTIADHNLTTDPLFVNAAAFNFNLQTSSPAIDAGVTLGQVPTDFKNTPRPQGGAYDIGAYERGGSSDIEPPQRPVGLVIR